MSPIRCPICGKIFLPEQSPALPFCGERCRLRDLIRWLDEDYGLPYEGDESENEDSRSEE